MNQNNNYEIVFYEDNRGQSETWDFIHSLESQSLQGNKQSKTLLNAIYRKLNNLRLNGTKDGMPDFEYMNSNKYPIWQIRIKHTTGYYRFFVCLWKQNTYVILSYFIKKQGKTPPAEIKRAETIMKDYITRNGG